MRTDSIGEFEELTLMAVAALEGRAYGLSVRTLLLEEVDRKVSLGAVHATLYRLQDKGFLRSELEGATERRGGRRKRMFRLTNTGIDMLHAVRAAREHMWELVPTAFKPGMAT